MAKRGRPPKSEAQRRLDGTPKLPLAPEIDITAGSKLVKPKDLTERQSAIWRDTIKAFPAGYFTLADKVLLLAYVFSAARLASAEHSMKNKSLLDSRGSGAKCVNPLIKLIHDETLNVKRLAEALAMTREKRAKAGVMAASLGPADPDASDSQDGGAPSEFGDLILLPSSGPSVS